MAEYHLYLDESGRFDRNSPDRQCLIGGFLCKRPVTEGEARGWLDNIKGEMSRTNAAFRQAVSTSPDLAAGERYVFNHCSENRQNKNRWEWQKSILEQIEQRLEESCPNVQIVIFHAPGDAFYIDVNTTYLTLMSLGILRLYQHLLESEPDKPVKLFVHAAQRANMLLYEVQDGETDQNELDSTPLPAQDENGEPPRVLAVEQYRSQLKNCAFLHGGYNLLKQEGFQNVMNTLEIVGGENNPLTVICDYICNSYWVSGNGFSEYFAGLGNRVLLFEPLNTGDLIDRDFSIDALRETHDWGSGLIELMSRDFPGAPAGGGPGQSVTQAFFSAMAEDRRCDQLKCVQTLVDYVKPFVENRENMAEWCKRLKSTMANCATTKRKKGLNDEAYNTLSCNLCLFLDAMYTHMGLAAEAKAACEAYVKHAAGVRDLEHRTRLMLIFANREIVSSTDRFDYDAGYAYSIALDTYWGCYEMMSNDLYAGIAKIWLSEGGQDRTLENAVLPEHGKVMGSESQLITHMLHTGLGNVERGKLFERGNELKEAMPKAFVDAMNRSRAWQNACRLEAEMAFATENNGEKMKLYQSSVRSLALAAGGAGEAPDDEANCRAVMSAAGRFGERSPFLYLHYVAIMNLMVADPSPDARELGSTMWRVATGNGQDERDPFAHLRGDAFPGCVALWHTASCAAHLREQGACAYSPELIKSLFEIAYKALCDGEATFRAISIGILAEELALMKKGALPGGGKDIERLAQALEAQYQAFNAGRDGKTKDPFDGTVLSGEKEGRALKAKSGDLFAVARRIAY